MFVLLKKEVPSQFFVIPMRRNIFYENNKTFFSTPNPNELKMFYSSRWNRLKFQIQVGYRTWIYRRAPELCSLLPEKRMKELKEEAEEFEKNRVELETYLNKDVVDPLRKEVEFLEVVLKKKQGEEKQLILNLLKQTLNYIWDY